MIFSRCIYFVILLHIVLILATAGAGLQLILSGTGYITGSILLLCSLFQIGAPTRRLNTSNREIKLFFGAVQGKNNMLYLPEVNVSEEQEQLDRSLNRLNDLLARTKGENQKQEHFYRPLLEEVSSGALARDASGQAIIANSAAFSLLKYNRLYTEMQLARLLNATDIRDSLSISRKEMILEGKTTTILSIKDIGDRLSDEENESWSRLIHVLTYEIMNAIVPVISLSQTLSAYPDVNEKSARGLRITQTRNERPMEFMESFRHLSYLPRPEKKRFSLTDMLHDLERLLQGDFHERGIHFMLQFTPDSIETDGDANQLSRVFLNLLRDAMQALKGQTEGRIIFRLQQVDRLLIGIEDNSFGIPEEIREQIFIPFSTTKAEGSGIGLSLCKQVIRQHDGRLLIHKSYPR